MTTLSTINNFTKTTLSTITNFTKTTAGYLTVSLLNGLALGGAAKLFAICNPTAAFTFSTTMALSGWAIRKLNSDANSNCVKIMQLFLSVACGVLAAKLLTGYQFTLGTLIVLHCATAGVVVIGTIAIAAVALSVILASQNLSNLQLDFSVS